MNGVNLGVGNCKETATPFLPSEPVQVLDDLICKQQST